ncbi:hypothetical protein V8C34DRAFT_276974 [Trichoderma compactum]
MPIIGTDMNERMITDYSTTFQCIAKYLAANLSTSSSGDFCTKKPLDTVAIPDKMESSSSSHPTVNGSNPHCPANKGLGVLFSDVRGPERDKEPHTNPSQPKPYPRLPNNTVFDARFWQEDVPMLVQNNGAVQSANLAVLILIFAQSAVGVGCNHYGKALSHYGRALQLVRETSTSQESLRPAILCSLFFVIFEIMNGDTDAAESHLWNGEKMVLELQRLESRARSIEMNGEGALRRELPCALQFLMLQSDTPNLNFEKAGYLEAFIRTATNPDRVPNMVPGAYPDQRTGRVERLL